MRVVDALRAAGHIVEAPDLPGLGADTTPVTEVSLASNTDRICDVIDSFSGDVVLVGHSLGGLTISQVAEHRADRLRCLVYLAAFLPVADPSSGDDDTPDRLTSPEIRAAIRRSPDGATLDFDVAAARHIFYGDCSDEDVAWACALLRPQPAQVLSASVEISEENYGRVPRDYIVCLQDRALPPSGQETLHRRSGCRNVYSMNTSHSPFFSAPEELAKILGALADH